MIKHKIIFIMFILLSIIVGCDSNDTGGKMSEKIKVNDNYIISEKLIEKISKNKIYFGHMSVGNNIIQGINDLSAEINLKLKIVETNNIKVFESPVFAHSRNGKNSYPKSKVDAFEQTIDSGLGNIVDIAFFKFCYVDIVSDTDIENIYHYYTEKMDKLEKRYPRVNFIHFTVPLSTYKKMSIYDKLKDFISGIIGKETIKERYVKSNIARNKYNELLRKKYGKDKLFDLAFFESIYPNDEKEEIMYKGTFYASLVPDYSYDGGHLNTKGRKRIAWHLLNFLNGLL